MWPARVYCLVLEGTGIVAREVIHERPNSELILTQAADTPNVSKTSLLGLDPSEMESALAALGEPRFRAKQIMAWLYKKRVLDFSAMTDLSAGLRAKLAEHHCVTSASVAANETDHEETRKLALRFPDGSVIESVLMLEARRESRDADGPRPVGNAPTAETPTAGAIPMSPVVDVSEMRRTACLSTQAGCAMGCRFCASGQLGLKRHLTAGEILEQVYAVAACIPGGEWLTNIVYMGMGEPLHNYEATVRSLRVLTSEWGFGFGARRITVSTVGFPRRIRDLADTGMGVNLAVSLHAPNDAVREKLIPTNHAYGGIEEVLSASVYYFEQTGRQVTFEYTLVHGENDRTEHARELASVVRRHLPGSNINLIPMNPVKMSGLRPPERDQVEVFAQILQDAGHSVHTRKKKGRAIAAACGQLRLRVEQEAISS